MEKAPLRRQVSFEKMNESELSDDASSDLKHCQNRSDQIIPGPVGAISAYGPSGSRCRGGMSSIQALVWNVRKGQRVKSGKRTRSEL